MRRIIIALVCLLALTGCAADVGKVDSGTGTVEQAANDEPAVYAPGDAIKIDDLVLTVGFGKVVQSGNEFIMPDAGKVFYVVPVGISNSGEEKADLIFTYKIEDANGVQTTQEYMLDVANPLEASSLAPGGKVGGNIAFQVPEDKKGLMLVIEPNVFVDQQVKVKLTK